MIVRFHWFSPICPKIEGQPKIAQISRRIKPRPQKDIVCRVPPEVGARFHLNARHFVRLAPRHSRVEFSPRGCGRMTAKTEIPAVNGNEIKDFGRKAKSIARPADSARALSLCGSF